MIALDFLRDKCHIAEFLQFVEKLLDIYWPTRRINGGITGCPVETISKGKSAMIEIQPTERELEALKVLWQHGEATVRTIADAMNAGDQSLAYTTVLSLLQVMEQKGLVSHRRDGKAYVYLPQVERDKTFRSLASDFLEQVFDGAVDEYLVHALQSRRLSADELDQLEAMITNARKETSSKQTPIQRVSIQRRKGKRK